MHLSKRKKKLNTWNTWTCKNTVKQGIPRAFGVLRRCRGGGGRGVNDCAGSDRGLGSGKRINSESDSESEEVSPYDALKASIPTLPQPCTTPQ